MFGRSITGARRRRILTAVAVCLFALRTLIPIGFMVSVGVSHAAVTLCPDYAPLPPSAAALHAHHHLHGSASAGAGSNDAQVSGVDGHGLCPFAAAVHLGWHGAPAVASVALDAQVRLHPPAADAAIVQRFLSLSRSARGPPLLNLG
jgi:hypothetical protein